MGFHATLFLGCVGRFDRSAKAQINRRVTCAYLFLFVVAISLPSSPPPVIRFVIDSRSLPSSISDSPDQLPSTIHHEAYHPRSLGPAGSRCRGRLHQLRGGQDYLQR